MGAGVDGGRGVVVVARAGAVRCLAADVVADLIARAVTLEAAGLEETPPGGPVVVPPVLTTTIELRHPGRVSRLAGRFVRRRLDGLSTTLVLRTRSVPEPSRLALVLSPVAPVPVAEVAAGASFDLVVPVGEWGRRRYATPVVTLVVGAGMGPVGVARRLVEHRAFLGEGHCDGDAALLHMATSGEGTATELNAALEAHESAVVVDLLRDAVRSPC